MMSAMVISSAFLPRRYPISTPRRLRTRPAGEGGPIRPLVRSYDQTAISERCFLIDHEHFVLNAI